MTASRRVLVAGATGVIGRRLVPALVSRGDEVFGLARSEQSAQRVGELGATPLHADPLDRDAVEAAVDRARPASGREANAPVMRSGAAR